MAVWANRVKKTRSNQELSFQNGNLSGFDDWKWRIMGAFPVLIGFMN
jgi:hypothetical protein